jgi:hypothetical protein
MAEPRNPPVDGNTPMVMVVIPPKTLPGFPGAVKVKPKTPRQGGGLRARWRDQATGRILEWDYQHGAVEVYDAKGAHIGEFNPDTGQQLKPADRTRKVTP